MEKHSSSIETISINLFSTLAKSFPVSCATDEFYFFPHIILPDRDWSTWDQFSEESISDTVVFLSQYEKKINDLKIPATDHNLILDRNTILRFIITLREQLLEFPVWKNQPTFYLTLICKGLEEAGESNNPTALHERITGLPSFLNQSVKNLTKIPVLFRDLGFEMLSGVRQFLNILSFNSPYLKQTFNALQCFEDALIRIQTIDTVNPFIDKYDHLLQNHYGFDMSLNEIEQVINQEMYEMNKFLDETKNKLLFEGKGNILFNSWKDTYISLPEPNIKNIQKSELFFQEVIRLRDHCKETGIHKDDLDSTCPVNVSPMPEYLSVIRAAASYSIVPDEKHPKGTFYIFDDPGKGSCSHESMSEYKMLTAHETYPGHHLLDCSRLLLNRTCRRFLESPYFYEGWACFAEDLMKRTGYFSTHEDHFLLAKRRYWRAIRGKADLMLNSGSHNLAGVAQYLEQAGFPGKNYLPSLQKYTLNPGYQLCYTLGIRKVLDLFNRYGEHQITDFVNIILSQGEICFSDLEEVFSMKIKKHFP